MTHSTPGIVQDVDPREWRTHTYGLPPERWKRLCDRSYWITGAGTGFGQAMATALASAGARVFLTGRRETKLHEAIEGMRSFGIPTDRCHAVPADLTKPDQVESAFAFIRTRCPSLQGLVNNAALAQRTRCEYPLQQETIECWDEVMRVNVRAPWFVTKTALPYMLEGGEVRAVFITSGAGWAFASGYGQYNVSKAALNSLTACLAEECRARYPDVDIQINGLDPGQARSEMNRGSNRSPFSVACMSLLLLSHPKGGPNGKFFAHDGRHLEFCSSSAYDKSLLGGGSTFPSV